MTKKSWLELAVSDDDVHTNLKHPHGCLSADGMRVHIEHENGACQCGDDKLHKNFDAMLEQFNELPFAFVVNRKYLLDALSGINPDGKAVVFFVQPNPKSPILIQDPEGERTAIIMPMYIKGGEKMKPLPRVTPEKKSSRKKSEKVKS